LPGQRRDDADRDRPQCHRQIVRQSDDPIDLDAGCRLVLVHRDDRTGVHADDPTLDTEVRELLLENLRVHQQRIAIVGTLAFGRQREDRYFGESEWTARPLVVEAEGLLLGLALLATLLVVIDGVRLLLGTHRTGWLCELIL